MPAPDQTVLDQEQLQQALAYLQRVQGKPNFMGLQDNARAVQSAVTNTQTPTSAGRFKDPTQEIGRLLDELQRNRDQIGQISLEPSANDIALQQRLQEATLTPALAQISGGFGARGLSGSSLEAVQRSLMANQVALQSQQSLRDIGAQRAEFEMGRNRQLFNSLVGSINATGMPGAPGTQLKKKKHGLGGILGGAVGALAGSVLGPVGTAIGSRIGSAIGGGGQTEAASQDNGFRYEQLPYA